MAKQSRVRPRNPKTHAAHTKDMWWQVYLPLGLGTLVVLGLAALMMLSAFGMGTDVNTSGLADAMLIMMLTLLIPLLIGGLVAIGGMVWGVMWLINWIPGNVRIVHDFLFIVVEKVTQYMRPVRSTALTMNTRFEASARSVREVGMKVEQRLMQSKDDQSL